MIPFFRRIRRKLANDNQFLRYSRYAIGEIVLVVVGILIALQINNWNGDQKLKALEKELSRNLYEELLNEHESVNNLFASEVEEQINLIDMLLREGKVINIDSILDNNEKHWAINRFSLITFIISYTAFYDPNFKLYKSAVNDGSISIIKDKKLISNLEFIYINGPDRIERLYEKEMKLNDNIRQYIAMNYGDKFSSESEIINGLWSEETTKEFLVEAVKDGSFRFLLHGKLTMLKSKKLILDEQIIPRIQVVLEKYK